MKTKGEYLEKFKDFNVLMETQLKHKINVSWLDNGREFISKEVKHFLRNMILRSKYQYHIGFNKTEWRNMQIAPSWT